MQCYSFKIISLVIFMLSFSLSNSFANDSDIYEYGIVKNLPDYYHTKMDAYGFFDKLISNDEILINGDIYSVDINTKIYTISTKYGSLSDLTQGAPLGIKLDSTRINGLLIKELYIFPQDSIMQL